MGKAQGVSVQSRLQPYLGSIVFVLAFGEDAAYSGRIGERACLRPGFCVSESDLPMKARVMPTNKDAAHAAMVLRQGARGRKQ